MKYNKAVNVHIAVCVCRTSAFYRKRLKERNITFRVSVFHLRKWSSKQVWDEKGGIKLRFRLLLRQTSHLIQLCSCELDNQGPLSVSGLSKLHIKHTARSNIFTKFASRSEFMIFSIKHIVYVQIFSKLSMQYLSYIQCIIKKH